MTWADDCDVDPGLRRVRHGDQPCDGSCRPTPLERRYESIRAVTARVVELERERDQDLVYSIQASLIDTLQTLWDRYTEADDRWRALQETGVGKYLNSEQRKNRERIAELEQELDGAKQTLTMMDDDWRGHVVVHDYFTHDLSETPTCGKCQLVLGATN